MNFSEIYSTLNSKSIKIDENIKLLFDPRFINNCRKYSIAQRMRKKSLSLLLNNNLKINIDPVNSFYSFLGSDNSNVIEYLNFDFSSLFKKTKLDKSLKGLESNSITNIGSEILSMCEENHFDYFSIILHGSQSDGQSTRFSDVDVSIFIKNKLINNEKELREAYFQIEALNKKIAFFDPVSHHKVFINLESDLDCYPESFMPISALEKGSSSKNHEITIKGIREDLDLKIESFFNILRIMIDLQSQDKINNLFFLKQLISSYFMLIILEFEIIFGTYLDKKNIFENKIHKYKSKKEIDLFNSASLIRSDWAELQMSNIGVSEEFIKNIMVDSINMSVNIQKNEILNEISEKYLI